MKIDRTSGLLILALAIGGAAACSKQASKTPAREALPKSDLAESLWLAAAPADAEPVLEVREKKKDGDAVTIKGRAKDFVDGIAAFTLTDPSLPPCSEGGDMKECDTPWDYCCTDPAIVARATATVEFHDANGVINTSARGFHGLDHLAHVTVVGTLKRDDAGNLTVLASRVHIDGG